MDLIQLGENLGLEPSEFADIVTLFVTTAESDIEKIKRRGLRYILVSQADRAGLIVNIPG